MFFDVFVQLRIVLNRRRRTRTRATPPSCAKVRRQLGELALSRPLTRRIFSAHRAASADARTHFEPQQVASGAGRSPPRDVAALLVELLT
jgi:hypothetical protein